MRQDRLLATADLLEREAIKDEAFDMRTWFVDGEDWPCGFAACAVGHACLSKAFQEQGLCLNRYYVSPEFNNKIGMEAVKEFYELSQDDALFLFGCHTYETSSPSKETVVDRLRNFVDAHASLTEEGEVP